MIKRDEMMRTMTSAITDVIGVAGGPERGPHDLGSPPGDGRAPSWIRWLAPGRLAQSWLPNYFSPFFDDLEDALAAATSPWVPLKELVDISAGAVQHEPQQSIDWIVRAQDNTITVARMQSAAASIAGGSWISLPSRALLVYCDPLAGLRFELWDSDIYGGRGAADTRFVQLLEKSGVDLAWIGAELRTKPYIRAQLRRAEIADTETPLSVATLLEVRIRVPEPAVMASSAMRFRAGILTQRILREAQARSARLDVRPVDFLLTGATVEERLTQFEEYLAEAPLFKDRPVFVLKGHRNSPRWVLQRLQRLREGERVMVAVSAGEVHSEWVDWTADASLGGRVFNSIAGQFDLPDEVWEGLAQFMGVDIKLPPFRFWRQVYLETGSLHEGIGPADWDYLVDTLLRIRGRATDIGIGPEMGLHATSSMINKVRLAYCPFLAVKNIFEDGSVRVYLLAGPDQVDDPLASHTLLEQVALDFSSALNRAVHFAAEVARRESLRRIRETKHTLARVLVNAAQGLEDLKRFAFLNPGIANSFIPDEKTAEQRAQMQGVTVDEYRMPAHIGRIDEALDPLKALTKQLQLLSQLDAMQNSSSKCILVTNLIQQCVDRFRTGYPDVEIHREFGSGCEKAEVMGERDLLSWVFDEVLSNAGRELKTRSSDDPAIVVSLEIDEEAVKIAVRDNALPAGSQLIESPFDEGTSTYHQSGEGSGFGLAIVKAIVLRHNGNCTLTPNIDSRNARIAGVTFLITLPLAGRTE